jgi:hypothetical protein
MTWEKEFAGWCLSSPWIFVFILRPALKGECILRTHHVMSLGRLHSDSELDGRPSAERSGLLFSLPSGIFDPLF